MVQGIEQVGDLEHESVFMIQGVESVEDSRIEPGL